ncbi:MAG: hypothetical protein HY319_14575 [Armatimonadetes bacterium]|nr:hypothetical protein [Armatimonadota bacterium]
MGWLTPLLGRYRAPLLVLLAAAILLSPFLVSGRVFIPADIPQRWFPWRAYGSQGVKNLELFDVVAFFYPQDVFYGSRLKQGDLPLWNPHLFAGHPAIASGQSAFLYPPRMAAHFLLPAAQARATLLLLHLPLIGLGLCAWLRSRGFRSTPAALGALTLMLSTYITTWMEYEHVVLQTAWLPWMLWAIDRGVEGKGARWWCLLGVMGALVLSAGHLQYPVYLGFLAGAYGIFRCLSSKRPGPGLGGLLLAGAIAVLVALPVLLPFLQLLQNSARLGQTPRDLSPLLAPLWTYLVCLVCPDALGNPSLGFLLNRTPASLTFSEYAIYVGLIPLLLGLVALSSREGTLPRREVYFWGALALLALAISVGLPPFRQVLETFGPRLVPSRCLLLFSVSLAVLAAQGAELMLSREPRALQLAARLGLGVAVAWGAVVAVTAISIGFFEGTLLQRLQGLITPQNIRIPQMVVRGPAYYPLLMEALRSNYLYNPQFYLPVALGLALAWCGPALGRERLLPRRAGTLLLVLTAADLLLFGMRYNPVAPPAALLPWTPGLRWVDEQPGLFRVLPVNSGYYNTLTPFGFEVVGGYESFLPLRYYKLLTYGGDQGVRSPSPHALVESPMAAALNIRYALVRPRTALKTSRPWEPLRQGDLDVYENRAALERTYVVGLVQVCSSLDQVLAAVNDPHFDPASVAAVEAPPPFELRPEAAGSPTAVTEHTPDRVVVRAEMRAPGLLVLADAWYPGWRCLDAQGHELPIVPVNGVLRGVYLPQGGQTLEFTFAPPAFYLGAKVSVAVLALLSLAGLVNLLLQLGRSSKSWRRLSPPAE